MRGRLALVAVLASALLIGACGGTSSDVEAADEREIEALDADALPGEILGLRVAREDISEILDAAKRPYLSAAALYSLREGEELQATLQIGRFADPGLIDDADYVATLLGTLGGGAARELRLEDRAVYLSSGDRQQVAVWFDDEHMIVLSTREEYERPRTLLRSMLEVEL